jgi:hypothetical protein
MVVGDPLEKITTKTQVSGPVKKHAGNGKRPHSASSDEDLISSGGENGNGGVCLKSARFLLIKHQVEGKSLGKMSPFIINRCVVHACGEPKGIKKLRNGVLLIEVVNEEQCRKLLKLTVLGNEPVVVELHRTLNTSKGVLSCHDLMEVDINEIREELASQYVSSVSRITRKEGGLDVPTPTLILTFSRPSVPERLKIGYLSVAVRPYVPNPRRCFQCQGFGHMRRDCQKEQTCARCGGQGHDDTSCSEPEMCVNCKGPHSASSRDCPIFKEERVINKISFERKITFLEARREYRRSSNMRSSVRPDVTFLDAVKTSPQPRTECSSCTELKEIVLRLTEQVATLTAALLGKKDLKPDKKQQSQTPITNKRAPGPKPEPGLSHNAQAKVPAKGTTKNYGTAKPKSQASPSGSMGLDLLDDMVEDQPHHHAEKFLKVMSNKKSKVRTKITYDR